MKKNILLIGPFPEPVSGVSLANQVIREVLDESDDFTANIIDTSYYKFDEKIGKISLKKLFFYLKLNSQIFKIFQNNIIYLTPGQTFFGLTKYSIFILLSSLLKKELIIHVHGNYLGTEYKTLSDIKKRIFYSLLSRATKGIVLSESLKKNMSPFIKDENIYVLHNFAENYLTLNNKEVQLDKLKIIFLSNLMRGKGILELLKALKILEKENIDYEAKIAGIMDENNKKTINRYLNKLKFTDYLGVVNGKEKKDLLEWSNIFVLPTYYEMEGQPISIIEAMATQNLIITTRHAGIPDIIKEFENGYFVEKKSIKSIVDQLKVINHNKSIIRQIAERNRIYFQEKFTFNHFKNNFLKILDS